MFLCTLVVHMSRQYLLGITKVERKLAFVCLAWLLLQVTSFLKFCFTPVLTHIQGYTCHLPSSLLYHPSCLPSFPPFFPSTSFVYIHGHTHRILLSPPYHLSCLSSFLLPSFPLTFISLPIFFPLHLSVQERVTVK